MGDKVRGVIEAMVWDLRAMENKGYFDQEEVKTILRTREDHEYQMNKFTSTPLDFLKAIQYEMELEELRKERFVELEFKKVGNRDYSIVKRIIFLFDRLCARFKYQPKFWKQYIRFCLQQDSKKNFYRALSNALRFNVGDLELWEISIYYEMEIRHNPFKGRKLFMSCLRINSKVKEAWISYLRFECKFIKMVENRENLLKEDEEEAKEDLKKRQESFGELGGDGFLGFDDDKGEDYQDLLASSDEEGDDEKEIELSKGRSNHQLIMVILESMIDIFGEIFEVYSEFLKVLREETGKSKEIKLARIKIFNKVKQGSGLGARDLVKLVAINRGLYCLDGGELAVKPSLGVKKLNKFLDEYVKVSKTTALKILSELYEGLHKFVLAQEEEGRYGEEDLKLLKEIMKELQVRGLGVLKHLGENDLEEFEPDLLMVILTGFYNTEGGQLEVVVDFIEKKKFEPQFLNLYLLFGDQEQLTDVKKLNYLDEYLKKIKQRFDSSQVSSTKKAEIKCQTVLQIAGHVKSLLKKVALQNQFSTGSGETEDEEDDDDSEDSDVDSNQGSKQPQSKVRSELKIIGVYITQLVKACNLQTKSLSAVAEFIEKEILEDSLIKNSVLKTQFVDMFAEKFLALRKACPENLYALFLQSSSKFNQEQHFDLAVNYHPISLRLWKLRLEFEFYKKQDLSSLQIIYNRALDLCQNRNQLMKIYQKIISGE